MNLVGEPGLSVVFRDGGGIGVVVLVILGVGLGRVHDLNDKVKEQAREFEHRASHDPFTDLPNRNLLTGDLERALIGADRGGETIAVRFLDLDDFKDVNDSLGHGAGICC